MTMIVPRPTDRDGDEQSDAGRQGRRAATVAARVGLAARSLFYCMLVYLVAQLALDAGGGRQANAHGALSTIARQPGGLAAIATTAAGFLAFGVTRVWAAIHDDQPNWWRRTATFVQGAFYVALTWVPASYALGRRSSGSEQQQHRTAGGILALPAGRELLFTLGLIVVGVCLHQIKTGVDHNYADGMDTRTAPQWVAKLVALSGTIGIPARAAVFLPVGIAFMIAAVQSDPRHADGLDAELAALARHSWGVAVLSVVATGLAVFALYSFLEARCRTLDRSV
jgi:Domain of Unknown Function (DUF1206)